MIVNMILINVITFPKYSLYIDGKRAVFHYVMVKRLIFLMNTLIFKIIF